jgi:anti-anti-sigma factor
MALEITSKLHDQVPMLEVTGKISDVDVEVFTAAFQKIHAEQHPRIILDISRVNFLDSQALGKIVAFNASMKREGKELVILNTNTDPEAFVPGLFAMTNLNKVLKVVTSL